MEVERTGFRSADAKAKGPKIKPEKEKQVKPEESTFVAVNHRANGLFCTNMHANYRALKYILSDTLYFALYT